MSERNRTPDGRRPPARGGRKADMPDRGKRRDRPEKPRNAEGPAPEHPTERIAKRLARAGISSRRDAEALVEAGRVTVNGKVSSSPAVNVSRDDQIAIDGTPIPAIERTRLFLFHKPAGVVTTNRDPEGRRTVFDALPDGLPRLMTVGRLDINTEGLLLLTNDGGLARMLELPSTGWLRRYRVRVHGEVEEAALAGLRDGIAVDGVFYGTVEAALDRKQGSNAWLTIGLREGKNREVKNILGALGLEVTRLIRVSYGPFQLGELPEGNVRELKGRTLRDQLGQKLIEEAGADFDAPVATPFSRKQPQAEEPGRMKPRPARQDRPLRIEEGGLVRNRKRERERNREDALQRLTTKDVRPRKDARSDAAPSQRRSANVWMAPGARPGKKKTGEDGPDTELGQRAKPGRSFPGKKGVRPLRGKALFAKDTGKSSASVGDRPASEAAENGKGRYQKARSNVGPKPAGKGARPFTKKSNERLNASEAGNSKRPPKRENGKEAGQDKASRPRGGKDRTKGKPGADRRR